MAKSIRQETPKSVGWMLVQADQDTTLVKRDNYLTSMLGDCPFWRESTDGTNLDQRFWIQFLIFKTSRKSRKFGQSSFNIGTQGYKHIINLCKFHYKYLIQEIYLHVTEKRKSKYKSVRHIELPAWTGCRDDVVTVSARETWDGLSISELGANRVRGWRLRVSFG